MNTGEYLLIAELAITMEIITELIIRVEVNWEKLLIILDVALVVLV